MTDEAVTEFIIHYCKKDAISRRWTLWYSYNILHLKNLVKQTSDIAINGSREENTKHLLQQHENTFNELRNGFILHMVIIFCICTWVTIKCAISGLSHRLISASPVSSLLHMPGSLLSLLIIYCTSPQSYMHAVILTLPKSPYVAVYFHNIHIQIPRKSLFPTSYQSISFLKRTNYSFQF